MYDSKFIKYCKIKFGNNRNNKISVRNFIFRIAMKVALVWSWLGIGILVKFCELGTQVSGSQGGWRVLVSRNFFVPYFNQSYQAIFIPNFNDWVCLIFYCISPSLKGMMRKLAVVIKSGENHTVITSYKVVYLLRNGQQKKKNDKESVEKLCYLRDERSTSNDINPGLCFYILSYQF